MIRDVGRSLGNAVVESVGRAVGRAQERKPLPVDLLEGEDAYLAVFDAPGATSSDVQVRLRNGVVEVRVDRFRDFHEGFDMRYPGRGLSLDGHVELPEGVAVHADGATAVLQDNGTLEVRIPKAETTVEESGANERETVVDESADDAAIVDETDTE
ncbi:MAG: Hsp20/alpha crystallin family protein [Haloarculaceae archaeon]